MVHGNEHVEEGECVAQSREIPAEERPENENSNLPESTCITVIVAVLEKERRCEVHMKRHTISSSHTIQPGLQAWCSSCV